MHITNDKNRNLKPLLKTEAYSEVVNCELKLLPWSSSKNHILLNPSSNPSSPYRRYYLTLRFLIYKDSVFDATSVFKAATKKTDCGTEAKTEGLISFATLFFFDWLHDPQFPLISHFCISSKRRPIILIKNFLKYSFNSFKTFPLQKTFISSSR